MADEKPLLDAFDLGFGYGRLRVWEHVNLTLYAGDIAFLIGPNGAGKTTLLKCLAGWITPKTGEATFLGERLSGRAQHLRRQIAFVADVPAFYDDLTAREHVDFVLKANRADAARRAEAEELLEAFGIAQSCDAYPSAFSRGMRQKLALVLGLMVHPKLLLMDEPTGPLDPEARELLGTLVKRAASEGTAVLMSCHHDLPGVEPNVVYELAVGTLREAGEDEVALGAPVAPREPGERDVR